MKLSKITADEFNAKYQVGTPVKYFPLSTEADYEETKTRTPAWTLGHGQVVVSVEGRSGGVCVEHIEIIPPA